MKAADLVKTNDDVLTGDDRDRIPDSLIPRTLEFLILLFRKQLMCRVFLILDQ